MAAHNLLRRTAIISQTRFSSRRNIHSSQPKCLNDSDNKKEAFIIMDFGNDINHRPPPLQVLDACLHSCAKLVRSLEEAKRRISECNTTTYTGFQVEVDRDTSNKFQTLPGVIIVLPDSYMDPVNNEYGGNKYINGGVIPRPPPGRNFRTDNQRPWDSMPQQGNPPYYQHNSVPHETRSYTPQVTHQGFLQQQNSPPQHNCGPSSGPHIPGVRDGYQGGQSDRVASMPSGPQNPGLGRDGYHFLPPPQQGNYNQDYSHRQGQMNNHGGNAPSGRYRSDSVDYGYNRPQPQRGNIPEDHGGNRSNSQHSITRVYEQTGHESFGQYGNGQRPNGNNDHGSRYAPHGESQRLLPTSKEQKNPPRAPTGFSDDPLLFD